MQSWSWMLVAVFTKVAARIAPLGVRATKPAVASNARLAASQVLTQRTDHCAFAMDASANPRARAANRKLKCVAAREVVLSRPIMKCHALSQRAASVAILKLGFASQ